MIQSLLDVENSQTETGRSIDGQKINVLMDGAFMHETDRDVVLRGTRVTFDPSAVRLPETTRSISRTDVQLTLQTKMKTKKKLYYINAMKYDYFHDN